MSEMKEKQEDIRTQWTFEENDDQRTLIIVWYIWHMSKLHDTYHQIVIFVNICWKKNPNSA